MIEDAAARSRSSFAAADRRRKEAALTGEQKAERQKAADERKAGQQRAADQKRDAAAKQEAAKKDEARKAEQKREADRKAEERKAAARQEAQKRADERKAAAWVAERQKQQAADALAEQRRQTARLRTQHREENRSLKSNESAALDRHWHAVKRIDAAEERALHEFDVKRGSLPGRAAELLKGRKHFDAQREDIAKRHETERMTKHRDLEALKERQSEIAQATRLRQVHERKAIFDRHRDERRDFARTQEAERPRQIEDRKQAFTKAAEIEQTHKRERAQERAQGPKLSR